MPASSRVLYTSSSRFLPCVRCADLRMRSYETSLLSHPPCRHRIRGMELLSGKSPAAADRRARGLRAVFAIRTGGAVAGGVNATGVSIADPHGFGNYAGRQK